MTENFDKIIFEYAGNNLDENIDFSETTCGNCLFGVENN